MRKADGRGLRIELLRPVAWIEEHGAVPGAAISLDLAEMGAVGEAEVLAVEPCPAIAPGPGSVVTGRFVHETDGSGVVELRLAGLPEPIGATANHPFWSLDRAAFVEAGELARGERLDTPWGALRVASVEVSARPGLLYNIETTEHVFRVGPAGTLVHNSCATIGAKTAPDQRHHSLPKFLGGNAKQNAIRLSNKVHTEFHRLLRQNLRDAGLPLNVGGRGGSRWDWARHFQQNPGAQRTALDAVLKTSRQIDAKHGTSIVSSVWENIMAVKFKAYP